MKVAFLFWIEYHTRTGQIIAVSERPLRGRRIRRAVAAVVESAYAKRNWTLHRYRNGRMVPLRGRPEILGPELRIVVPRAAG